MEIFFFVLAILVVVLIWQHFSSNETKVKGKLRKVPLMKICDVQEGEYVKIIGTVSSVDNTLESPISGRKCMAYYIRVEEKSSGKNSTWHTIIEEHKSIPFLLQDSTGTAWVKLQSAVAHFEMDRSYHSGTFNDASAKLESFLKKFGESSVGMLGFNKSLRYSEGIIEAGEVVSILGYGTWLSSERPSIPLADPSEKILVIQEGEEPVYVTDAEV